MENFRNFENQGYRFGNGFFAKKYVNEESQYNYLKIDPPKYSYNEEKPFNYSSYSKPEKFIASNKSSNQEPRGNFS